MRHTLHLLAHAKINLTLNILEKRADGYHNLSTVMQSVGLSDRITLRTGEGLRFCCKDAALPTGEENTAVAAASLFFGATGLAPAVTIELEKQIPQAAGLAGGSADAAAVLAGLNRMYGAPLEQAALLSLAQKIGADVPFCLLGGSMLAAGVGERLTPLPPMPDCGILILKPCAKPSTGEMYRRIDRCDRPPHPPAEAAVRALEAGRLSALAAALGNTFSAAWEMGEIPASLAALKSEGALGASLSGSGPSVFGLFETRDAAEAAAERLKGRYPVSFAVPPARRGVEILE